MPRADHDAIDGIDVVAFAPHPDDVELFCGGTMLAAAVAGLTTAIVDLTDGELSTNGTLAQRARERDEASALLGLAARRALSLPDGGLATTEPHRLAVVAALRELRPRVVLAPFGNDRHPDHEAAAELVRQACFLAGLPRYGSGSPHRPTRVYRYMLHTPFEPKVVVDVGAVWDARSELLRVYKSQVSLGADDAPTALNDGRFIAMLEARAAYYGALAGVTYAEVFDVDGPVLVKNLLD
ncbi:MAG TPA: bacillithiol biosynthesis deacetylase BshB1 [Candidatus Limnocylindrales bacterium]|nr:bacillithiol biosynthesis deacetylase BshB1 [Candidatus Limnocylindrales bacterium]